jgi:nucleoside phosphorylase
MVNLAFEFYAKYAIVKIFIFLHDTIIFDMKTISIRDIMPRVVGKNEFESLDIGNLVLIITATDVEKSAFLRLLTPIPGEYQLLMLLEESYTFLIGRFASCNVVYMSISPGNIGLQMSQLSTSAAISFFGKKLKAVICTGIAFGLWPKRQSLGDILVSEKISSYQRTKINNGNVEDRGTDFPAGPVLLNRFAEASIGWRFRVRRGRYSVIHKGAVISGESLLNDRKEVDKLRERYPDAIGGEMEGLGIASVALGFTRPEWIVVKGISDWADGKKSDDSQPKAARSAVSLVFHVLGTPTSLSGLEIASYPDDVVIEESKKYSLNARVGTPLWMLNQFRCGMLSAMIRDIELHCENGYPEQVSQALLRDFEGILDLLHELPVTFEYNLRLLSLFSEFVKIFSSWAEAPSKARREKEIKRLRTCRKEIGKIFRENTKRLHSQSFKKNFGAILYANDFLVKNFPEAFPNLSREANKSKKKIGAIP